MKKVLIANRGEIACRIIESCRSAGLSSVAVCSEADASARHVELADEVVCIGPPPAKESYLNGEAILAAARSTRADSVHPGYGFLAENASFAQRVHDTGLAWIGPDPKVIADMGDKERARDIAAAAGVPVLPGSPRFRPGLLDGLEEQAAEIGYPLLVKAAGGGGGIGMQRVDTPEKLRRAVEATQSMAEKVFGDGTIYLERCIDRARHIEVQVFGDGAGHGVHLFDRDCSVQRRYQKIIEEAPAPALPDQVRHSLFDAALALVHHTRYKGAGTVEFVYDRDTEQAFFLEMNTRLQVEHPVTEMVTGIDIVRWQLAAAAGESLPLHQETIALNGHAVEARIYAEKPEKNFMPAPGRIDRFDLPRPRNGIRIDTGVRAGDEVTPFYDPLIAKIIALGDTRQAAINKLESTLEEIVIEPLRTNRSFLIDVLQSSTFTTEDVTTDFVKIFTLNST